MQTVLAALRQIGYGLGSALLPSPERERLARAHGIDAPRWSVAWGLVQMFAGGLLFLIGGLQFMRPNATDQSMMLLGHWFPGLSTTHFQGLGLLNWFAWFLHPASWPLAYAGLIGATRCIAFAATREAVGEPAVWAALRGWQWLRERVERRSFERRLGPWRPDRVEPADDGLVGLTCRQKSDWRPATTIAIDERLYELTGVEQREDGDRITLAYRLRELHPGHLVRRLVEYEPPTGP